jgi:hypothetical protein
MADERHGDEHQPGAEHDVAQPFEVGAPPSDELPERAEEDDEERHEHGVGEDHDDDRRARTFDVSDEGLRLIQFGPDAHRELRDDLDTQRDRDHEGRHPRPPSHVGLGDAHGVSVRVVRHTVE